MILKLVLFIKTKCDNYLYRKCYIPKHADKDFWGDDL